MEDVHEAVHDLIEELTTTSKENLNTKYMKQLKTLCKNSDVALQYTFSIIMEQLGKPHAEIRYSAFKIVIELFSRSHLFRKLVLNNLCKIFMLTVGTDVLHYPLPLPLPVQKKLKLLVLKSVNEWHKKYGSAYGRITLGYEFLRDMKKVNFAVINATVEEEKRKERLMKEKEEKRIRSQLEQVDMQVYDKYDDIIKIVKEMENVFDLFLPKVEKVDDDGDGKGEDEGKDDGKEKGEDEGEDNGNEKGKDEGKDDDNKKDEDEGKNGKNDGVSNEKSATENEGAKFEDMLIGNEIGIRGNYSVAIEISDKLKITEDETNSDLIKRMDELYIEINQQQANVKRWLSTLHKYKSSDTKKVRRISKLKSMLSTVSKKYLEITVIRIPGKKDNDDDDFIDVPEKLPVGKYSCTKRSASPKSMQLNKTEVKSVQVKDNSTKHSASPKNTKSKSKTEVKPVEIKGSTDEQMGQTAATDAETISNSAEVTDPNLNRKERLMKVAPVIPYDIDLEYWGKDVKPVASIKVDSQHRFWKTNEHVEEFVPPDVVESMRTRVMQYPVKFIPVDRKCGALLPSGKLCERMDRYKCPFHGKIVERDEMGVPVDPEERLKELKKDGDESEEAGGSANKTTEDSGDSKEKAYVPFGMEPYKKKRKIKTVKEEKTAMEIGGKKTKAEIREKKKERYARLADVSAKATETPNKRLEKIVCSSRSLKKINANMDSVMKKKQLGKFGDNFNYY